MSKESYQFLKDYQKEKHPTSSLVACVLLGIVIGSILTFTYVQLEINPHWVTKKTCDNISNQEFLDGQALGLYLSAARVSATLNFTFTDLNNTLVEMPLNNYCNFLFQTQLNSQEVKS